MFPYRRGNKKRGKVGPPPGRQGPGAGGPSNQGRRPSGSAHELLTLLQPTTKALALALGTSSRAGNQVARARSVLEQAEILIEERMIDRLIPAHREEFLEQVARLKLTLADAEAELLDSEEVVAEPVRVPQPVSMDRLRALALSLAAQPAPAVAAVVEVEPEEEPAPAIMPERAPRTDIPEGSPRAARLRLRRELRPADKTG